MAFQLGADLIAQCGPFSLILLPRRILINKGFIFRTIHHYIQVAVVVEISIDCSFEKLRVVLRFLLVRPIIKAKGLCVVVKLIGQFYAGHFFYNQKIHLLRHIVAVVLQFQLSVFLEMVSINIVHPAGDAIAHEQVFVAIQVKIKKQRAADQSLAATPANNRSH
ncbi:MAG: hypothetical protein R2792_03560 [Saprospiraceae bacterium]